MLYYYKPHRFCTEEFVDKETFSKRGELAITTMDVRMLWTADAIRDYFDKSMVINNWKWDGNREWSGIRTGKSQWFSQYSQHTFGRALDFKIPSMDPAEIRQAIKKNHGKVEAFKYITRIEEFTGMSWVHIDCACVNSDKLVIFNPKQ